MADGPDDWNWWWGVWRNRVRCGSCQGLMNLDGPCPVCGTDYRNVQPAEIVHEGKVLVLPPTFAGALDWSMYAMLQLMYRDWLRAFPDVNADLPKDNRTSSRVLTVLIFWTFFETLMGWFYETATNELPSSVAADLLNRYGSIGSRLDRLHRILFGTRYGDDLDQLGFTSIRRHLENVQTARNAFMHGKPEAISDALVEETATMIPSFQEAWIQTFNRRCAKPR